MARKPTAILRPNLGLYLDKHPLEVPVGALQDGNNFRIKDGRIVNSGLGEILFDADASALNGAVRLITTLEVTGVGEQLIAASLTDIYRYDSAASGRWRFITPVYVTGTAAASGTAVTGTGTTWTGTTGGYPNAKAGDEISFGSNAQNDPAATWFTILSVDADTGITLTASAGTVVDGNYTLRRKFTGDILTHWDHAVFVNAPTNTNTLYITNGIQNVFKWTGGSGFGSYLDLGFTCKHLAVYSNMLIYLNLVQSGVSIPAGMINSNVGEPENVTTGLSEQFVVHSAADPIVDAWPLGDNLAIYSVRNIVLAQFVGDPFVFAFRKVINDVGAIAENVVADFGDFHEFIGQDALYRFDGTTAVQEGLQVWPSIIRERSVERLALSFAHFDETEGELLLVMPLNTDTGTPPSTAYVEHYTEDMPEGTPKPISKRDFGYTAAGYTHLTTVPTWHVPNTTVWDDELGPWDNPTDFAGFQTTLLGTEDGLVYVLNTGEVQTRSFVRFGRVPLGSGRERGLLKRLYPFVKGIFGDDYALTVTTRFADHASGDATITQTDEFDLSLPQGGHFVTPYRRGRFFDVEFSTEGPNQTFELEGYDTDVVSGGER